MPTLLNIDIAFDLVCPWCLIAKRQLENALQQFSGRHPDAQVQLTWHAVQLLPQIPDAGFPFLAFYEKRLGNLTAVKARQSQVKTAANAVGLTINFEKIFTMPNTARAHALLAYVERTQQTADYETLLDRLFTGFFVLGEDIGDRETLSVIAEDWGLPAREVSKVLSEAGNLAPNLMGAGGVPYFIFNGRHALGGAEPASKLLAHMEVALAESTTQGMVSA